MRAVTQVILSNWNRPDNVAEIVKQLVSQSVRFDKIVLVDNAKSPEHKLKDEVKAYADDVWDFPDNKIGPPCRFAPALVDYRPKYTLFLDDDFMVGTNMHKTLLAAAAAKQDMFATIGDVARVYQEGPGGKLAYVIKDVRRDSRFDPQYAHGMAPVDLTCRAHFVQTKHVVYAIEFRQKLLDKLGYPTQDHNDWTRHDDILLCHGIQAQTGWPSYLLPAGDSETRIIKENLPEPGAMWLRPGHKSTRQLLVDNSPEFGWNSLVYRG